MRAYLVGLILFLIVSDLHSAIQSGELDSLAAALGKHPHKDTLYIDLINNIAWELKHNEPDSSIRLSHYAIRLAKMQNNIFGEAKASRGLGVFFYILGQYDSSLYYSLHAEHLYSSINNKKGIAAAVGLLGILYYEESKYDSALIYFRRALEMDRSVQNEKGEASNLSNIALVYDAMGDYPNAIDYHLKALSIHERLQDESGRSISLGNIGLIYEAIKDYEQAISYYEESLELARKLNDKRGIGFNTGSLGDLFAEMGQYEKAIEYLIEAIKIEGELGHKSFVGVWLHSLGMVYIKSEKYDEALKQLFEALAIQEELGNRALISQNKGTIGHCYLKKGDFKRARIFLEEAIELGIDLNALESNKDNYKYYSEFLTDVGEYKKALEYYKKYQEINDSVLNADKEKEITIKALTYEFDKREAIRQLEQDKKDALYEAKIDRQRSNLMFYSVIIIIMGVSTLFIFDRYKTTRAQKQRIEEQERKTSEQKQLIQAKNEQMSESIRYAKHLQEAILPTKEELERLLGDYFLLYRPKDIVSGDFYWAEMIDNKLYFAVADCTGHGVPGAIVSVVCYNALKNSIHQYGCRSASEILQQCRRLVIESLHKSKADISDGMDISLCIWEKTTNQLEWAGANMPLWWIRQSDKQIQRLRATKEPIGQYPKKTAFVSHHLQLQKGDLLILSTDGYADQFGGDSNKKFSVSRFKQMLVSFKDENTARQGYELKLCFDKWKGQNEQLDDVCVLGVKV